MKNENDSVLFSDKTHDANIDNDIYENVLSDSRDSVFESLENDFQSLIEYCVMDFSGQRFSCIHNGQCHEQTNCFKNGDLQENLDFHQLQFHPEDRMRWCGEAFPDILKFIDSEPVAKIPDYRFIFNHRYIRKDGNISQFMHEGSISFTEDKLLPVLNLKVFFEIADNNKDETIVLTIFRYFAKLGYQQIFTKTYGLKKNTVLTERELEVIKLCYEGLSSKMIAEKLNLSFHTVKNHKRNCMEKTQTHNITKLIHHCLKNNWL
jgi:DNA-binding CsgD family transcriptional regulator